MGRISGTGMSPQTVSADGGIPFAPTTMSSKAKPLALSDTLRDLALLRVSDVDLDSLLPPEKSTNTSATGTSTGTGEDDVDSSVKDSYEYASEARKAIKLLNKGDVDIQGAKVEDLRSQLEDMLKGLEQKS